MSPARPTSRIIAAAVLIAAAGVLSACSGPGSGVVASGRIADDLITVGAPLMPVPTASIPSTASASARSRPGTVTALVGLGQALRVSAVETKVGDRVVVGQPVARLDDTALAAAVEAAQAARRAALARIGVIGARLDDVAAARSTIAETRTTVRDAIAQLTSTRAELVAKRAGARAQLTAVRTQLATLEALQRRLRQLPPPGSRPPTGAVPPGTPDPATVAAGIARLRAAEKMLVNGIGQLDAGISKIDAGLSQARSGLARLGDASASASDARSTLLGIRRVGRVASEGTAIAVDLARLQRDLAVLRSPVAGVVVDIVNAGESVVPGAPVATIRPIAASSVDVYLPPDAAARVKTGASATVRIDSRPGQTYAATVSRVGARALYPPSWMSTTETHMTRAIPVRVTLEDASATLPAGTPADVSIDVP